MLRQLRLPRPKDSMSSWLAQPARLDSCWLADHGWRKVPHFVQGYPAWQAAGYPVETGSKDVGAAP